MYIYGKMHVILSFLGILALTTACQKIPEPAPETPQPAEEKKVHDLILSLAGEVGECDPKTGHINGSTRSKFYKKKYRGQGR